MLSKLQERKYGNIPGRGHLTMEYFPTAGFFNKPAA